MKPSHAAWPALLCLAASTAFAQTADRPGKFYVGVQLGQAELDRENVDIPGDFDDHDFAYGVLAGFRFSRFYALEFGYTDIGEYSASFPNSDTGRTALKNFVINNVVTWPIDEHFHLKVWFGMNYFDLSGSLTHVDTGTTTSFSDQGSSYNAGLGMGVPINQHLELSLDITQYRALKFDYGFESEIDLVHESNATVVMLGARYRL